MMPKYLLHIVLFIVSLITTTIAGTEHMTLKSFFYPGGLAGKISFEDLFSGLPFSLSFLTFLTVHEFGHYFTSVYHKVKCTLPYYLPILIPLPGTLNIGSLGAVIRIKEVPSSRRKYFDIGVAGPLAGVVVSISLVIIGLLTLPDLQTHILNFHPAYITDFGGIPDEETIREASNGQVIFFGESLMYRILSFVLPIDRANIPPSHEIMHYPFLFAGSLTLFFTALNLLPIGQFDGGHVVYGLFGRKRASVISRITVIVLLMVGGAAVMRFEPMDPLIWKDKTQFMIKEAIAVFIYLTYLYYIISRAFKRLSPLKVVGIVLGMAGIQALIMFMLPFFMFGGVWLVFAFMGVTFVGLDHPEAEDDIELSNRQKVLGWIAILLFFLCVTPFPIYN